MIGTIPAGVCLDAWPNTTEAVQDSPEVAELREELRRSLPQVAIVLETIAKLQYAGDLRKKSAIDQK